MVVVPWRLHERSEDVKASAVERMRKLLMTSSYSRTQDDYEFMDRSLNVVIDLTRVHINTKREMNDILNRAKIYSCLHNPGVGVDFRHHILRDPVAEEMMVVNAKELYARMHPESVHRDLTINAQWNKCRDSIWASNGASNVSVERTGAASSSPLHQSPGPRPPSTPLESKGGSTTRHRTTQILLDKSARRVQLDDHTSIPETVSTAFKAITQTAT
ncbi:hypothetical protein B5M09_007855 [Aphanomyces astaci]|uniref:Uncharacterized protein n=1 Tax=Aphanomyces astaci TaxID=112090 RepID=A0A3R7YD88_APHAT|nr:hypothetical protein B5M09_007855 [Aphanomyces astaci]